MPEPKDTPPKADPADLDARLKALEEYVASQPSASPSPLVPGGTIEFTGGTVVHVTPLGIAALAGVALTLIVIAWSCCRAKRS